ncbi:MAG: LytTR family DNA-binding domain-containing protein [Bacteroidales bacterium]|jgi:DNA-binding LytR/AlgR family response regulator
MNVKCLLVDDEPLALRVIENHIEKIQWLDIAGTCQNPVEAYEILKTKKIDLLFLDIQMPELSGLEFLKTLRNPPQVIFTTAYRQFATDAYDLDVLDYLVKPIGFPRFAQAVNKYLERTGKEKGIPLVTETLIERRSFFIRKGSEMVRIYVDEILYFESMKDYLQIFLKGEKIIYKARISDMEEELEDEQFLRIHKSYLVNTSKIRSVSPTEIAIEGIRLPIGRTFKNGVQKKLGII